MPVKENPAESATTGTAADLAAELESLEDQIDLNCDSDLAQATVEGIERRAETLDDIELGMRARLMRAELRDRIGQAAAVARTYWEVNTWAATHERTSLLARSHFVLANTFRNLGDPAAMLEHCVRAVELLDDATPPRKRSLYLTRLADALKATGSVDAARERYAQAERLAVAIDDVDLQILVLNNLAYTECECVGGDPQRGWAVAERMRAVAAAHGRTLDSAEQDTVAQLQIALGRHAEAVRSAEASIREHHIRGYDEPASLAECLLTLATAQRLQGDTAQAQATLDRSRALCDERDLAGVRARVLQEQADLQAARGDHARAYETYKIFHAAEKDLVSKQREAQALTRQAMFETAEARQEAERFREQARRDPLTGLRNRRFVDEHLPVLIEEVAGSGTRLIVALIDLDHFKRINDTCSHDVGDQVLVAVADMLAAAVPTGTGQGAGFAARLGGEEFLVVLTGTSPAAAVELLEDHRRAVAARSWRPLTGDLPVTVSIGVTAILPGSTQSSLLARADDSLYAAKRGGRNRICVDPEVSVVEPRRYRS